ncbi:related to NmrA-like family protein [Phialocephala subalpina]|uniref:Related to NmrA-like family protein n=1 Tax=Phialocephala subalpina TaxID=576137 RepID=A0A1L7XX38_9HELO|nr:related to NmrA-like family protein [Phialocephala subalpina]
MAPTKTIIFGPTGSIGSATSLTAHSKGADIIFAMRDTSKSIPNLTPEAENSGHYTRIQADLTSPSSVLEAVTKTGAKRAFLYLMFGSPDNQRASIEGLKKGGVEFVVFLSSGGVHDGALEDVPSRDFISWSHAQVEINLRDVFGEKGYVAVRPKYFATNSLGWKPMIAAGEVRILHPEAQWDWITPKDIGLVCGRLLVDGFEVVGGRNWVRLSGPELISQKGAIETIGKALGKEIKVTGIGEEEYLEVLIKFAHMPEVVAKNFVRVLNGRMAGDDGVYDEEGYAEEVGNVMKYGGKKPTTFEEWVAENKEAFLV